MSEPFLGQIMLMANNYPPRGWHVCDGTLLGIAQNSALFALLGLTYGGDGRSTFGLPDLRSRVPVCAGSGPGLSSYQLGQKGGSETVTLTVQNLAPHTHVGTFQVVGAGGRGVPSPETPTNGDYPYVTQTAPSNPAPPLTSLAGVNTQAAGNGAPFMILPPYLALNYYIALTGIYPSRN